MKRETRLTLEQAQERAALLGFDKSLIWWQKCAQLKKIKVDTAKIGSRRYYLISQEEVDRVAKQPPKLKAVFSAILIFLLLSSGSAFAQSINSVQAVKCILGEARGEPYEGQVAVGEVLRKNPTVPFYGAQTIKTENGKWYAFEKKRWVELPSETVSNAKMAWLESENSNYSRGATNFEGDAFKRPSWAQGMTVVAHIGHQIFFR